MRRDGRTATAHSAPTKFGFKNLKGVNWNLGTPALYEHSLQNGEASLTADGALCAETGVFTGRSPKDKFTVRDAPTDKTMWWAGNQSITAEQFENAVPGLPSACAKA